MLRGSVNPLGRTTEKCLMYNALKQSLPYDTQLISYDLCIEQWMVTEVGAVLKPSKFFLYLTQQMVQCG